MSAPVSYFGIRHHGPGSARRLIEALDELRPVEVLVEGPADLSDQLPLLASADMVPPVALLAYPKNEPEQALFWPFAVFSPEYQAICWAVKENIPVRFIDLPVAARLPKAEEMTEDGDKAEDSEGAEEIDGANAGEASNQETSTGQEGQGNQPETISLKQWIYRDPIGVLAHAAGYEDGESWWRDVIEENPDPGPIFAAVSDAMTALREEYTDLPELEAAREAHMRLEIAKSVKAVKETDGHIAVVCGAWHAPALKARHTAKDDRQLLKGQLPEKARAKVTATWAPWTSPRLAFASGYGAGVAAPGWCKHLWDTQAGDHGQNKGQDQAKYQATLWLTRIAATLRKEGNIISTASLIEAERLANALASVRGRPLPGYEELREAVVACLCFGDPTRWKIIEKRLLLGNEVGAIPQHVPAAPLLEDLQRQQSKARMKPEALQKELSLDLRSQSGHFRSTLLHRLLALNVPWGQLSDAGRSRGTFRERWIVAWQPEFAVELVENLVYGTTIEAAAGARLSKEIGEAHSLGTLADLVFTAMTAQLNTAAATGIERLGKRAAQTSDALELLNALPKLADVIRYGEARRGDSENLEELFVRIATQGALSLHHGVRNLDMSAAREFARVLRDGDSAIRLVESSSELLTVWTRALKQVIDDSQAARLITGVCARLLYEGGEISTGDAVALLTRMLSPGTAPGDAAACFEGFFEGSGQRLLYDSGLRETVDEWLVSLDEETFIEYLPVFRRVLSELDRSERKRLLDALFGRKASGTGRQLAENAETLWPEHFAMLTRLLEDGQLEKGREEGTSHG